MSDLDRIVAGLEPLLGRLSGVVRPLDGGITNRNYRVALGAQEYVVRLPGKDTALLGISRESERLASQAAAALGIAPPVAAVLDDCLVTGYVPCAPIAPADLLEGPHEVARALRTFHAQGPRLPTRFDVPSLLEDYAAIVARRGGSLPPEYARARAIAARIAAALPAVAPGPCHDDLLPANLIKAEDGPLLLVDWEYAGMGDPFFDLGNLSVNNGFDPAADERLLHAYLDAEPAPAERARLTLMRAMSDAREAAWGVVQGAVSELDFDFAGYADEHFARLEAAVASPRFEDSLDAARA
jgi:aminoglycoside phosphotransferase (APT) family kinase protein